MKCPDCGEFLSESEFESFKYECKKCSIFVKLTPQTYDKILEALSGLKSEMSAKIDKIFNDLRRK